MNNRLKKVVITAVIAGIYTALTYAFMPIGYGPVNFRISEALVLLPFFSWEAVIGVTLGCLISNMLSPYGIIDMVFGTLATFIGAVLTYYIGRSNLKFKKFLAPLPPVIANGIIIGIVINLTVLSGPGDVSFVLNHEALLSTMLFVGLGEFIVCYFIGLPLIWEIEKNKKIREYL